MIDIVALYTSALLSMLLLLQLMIEIAAVVGQHSQTLIWQSHFAEEGLDDSFSREKITQSRLQ